MSLRDDLLLGFEIHSPEKIKQCIANGSDIHASINGKSPIDILIEMYLRSDRFSHCVRVLIDAGVRYDDKPVLSVLLGDVNELNTCLDEDPSVVNATYNIPYAFTPLEGVTLLHICAEFNKVDCAGVLIARGADVNAAAAVDADGTGGQTPIFHTVNSKDNFAYPMLELLLENGASLDVNLKGINWGKRQEWETYIPGVNPISYAMMGNLAQFERKPEDLVKNIEIMQKYKYGYAVRIKNVPNAYLTRSRKMKEEHILKALDW